MIMFEQIDKGTHDTWSVFVGFPGSTAAFLLTAASVASLSNSLLLPYASCFLTTYSKEIESNLCFLSGQLGNGPGFLLVRQDYEK